MLIFIFCLAGVCVRASAHVPPEEFEKCLGSANNAIYACHNSAFAAKNQADAMAGDHRAKAGRDHLNQASDREAAVTKSIAEILGQARASCEAQAKNCTAHCSGEMADFGQACAKDVGKYAEQLSQGFKQNILGNQGSTRTDAASTGEAGSGSSALAGGANSSSLSSTGNSSSLPNDALTGKDLANIVQKPVSGATKSSSGSAGGSFASASAATAAAFGESQIEQRKTVLAKVLQGSELSSAIESYCKNSGATDAECDRISSAQFCAPAERAQCPSCSGKPLEKFTSAEIAKACTSLCAEDPKFGPKLADKCRSVVGLANESGVPRPGSTSHNAALANTRSQSSSNIVKARAPARASAHQAHQEIVEENGIPIFRIVSQTIEKRCLEAKLHCGK